MIGTKSPIHILPAAFLEGVTDSSSSKIDKNHLSFMLQFPPDETGSKMLPFLRLCLGPSVPCLPRRTCGTEPKRGEDAMEITEPFSMGEEKNTDTRKTEKKRL